MFTVTSFDDNIKEAVDKSLETLENIYFEDIYYRDDIGFELIK